MRPALEIQHLKARIAVLEGQLAVQGLEPLVDGGLPGWAESLTRQQRALMGALIAAYPRALDAFQIDEILPHHDHAADRDLRLAASIVHAVRRKLGREAIQTVWGAGYRAGQSFAPEMSRVA